MEKRIILIAFAFSVLLAIPFNYAFAQNELTFTNSASTTQNIIASDLMEGNNSIWGIGGTTTSEILVQWNSTGSILRTVDFDVAIGSSSYDLQGIWCSKNHCFITTCVTGACFGSVNDAQDGQIHRFNSTGFLQATFTADVNTASGDLCATKGCGIHKITGRDALDGNLEGVNLYFSRAYDDNANRDRICVMNGSSMLESGCMPTTNTLFNDIEWSEVGGQPEFNTIISTSQDNTIRINRLSGLNLKCSVAQVGTDIEVDSTFTNYSFWIVNGANAVAYDSSCLATGDSFGATQTGFTTNINKLIILHDRDIMIAMEASISALVSVMSYNENTLAVGTFSALYETFPASSQTSDMEFFYVTALDKIFKPLSGSDRKILIGTFATAPSPPAPVGGIDCTNPANANILICRLGGSGTLGSAGAFVIGNVSAGTGILGVGCTIGLVDCISDPNPQTNGLGLLIFIASIFVVVGMFFRSLGANATFQMPVFVWIIIILALSAFFTITGLIDPVFLIVSVIALIALASPKVIRTVQGQSGFGGGSTE